MTYASLPVQAVKDLMVARNACLADLALLWFNPVPLY